jgi:hypothetical protein
MKLREKSETINTLLFDLRAEYLVSCLLAGEVSQKDILAIFDGPLKRKWSADVSYSEVESFEDGKDTLSIHLNRAGIYDSLPEALFHLLNDNRNAKGEDMAKESMRLKAEEKQARSFFRPFETEIFLQNVSVAYKESQEFQSLYSDLVNSLVPGFWKIDEKIPSKYASEIIRFLPFAHKLTGNYDLTAQCLEQILEEKVSIELCHEENDEEVDNVSFPQAVGGSLGKSKLGTDLVVGNSVSGFIGKLVVKIGPLKNTKTKDFFPDGPADLLMNCFLGYFIPVELNIETKLLMDNGQQMFGLSTETEAGNSYLGYNTVL